jgi:hypothetical protein
MHWHHAAARATRFGALEPIRQGVRRYFGDFASGIARGLAVLRRAVHPDAQRKTCYGCARSRPSRD